MRCHFSGYNQGYSGIACVWLASKRQAAEIVRNLSMKTLSAAVRGSQAGYGRSRSRKTGVIINTSRHG